MNTEPLSDYIQGIKELEKGNRDDALRLMAKSIGTKEPSQYMQDNLDKLAESNPAMLRLILNECQK